MVGNDAIFIALGSNLAGPLGQPATQIELAIAAVARLLGCTLTARSQLYRSAALHLPLHKRSEQPDYINAVIAVESTLSPPLLLAQLQGIEAAFARQRGPQRWSARTLDLDLLSYAQEQYQSDYLTLPHPEMSQRSFVLLPLFEIAPDYRLSNGLSVRQQLKLLPPSRCEIITGQHAAQLNRQV
ncbi:MAG: 2-amino-4-hydroxy-6-hydroxymethyldihydropteridine diphosphokinase [Gammaproteobacteria bacterium]|nr:2-amino-4-hydroxy-6-hydroxymethyldihydropteridine diphosphokinase [Gammaproteobacteria bacterium]